MELILFRYCFLFRFIFTSVVHYQCDILMTGVLKKGEYIFFPNFVFSIGFQVSLLKKNIT